MALSILLVPRIFIFLLTLSSTLALQGNTKVFDIRNYGAVGDGKRDNTLAFSRAWDDACQFSGEARVYVPVGIYMLKKVDFIGPCLGRLEFHVKGVIRAPYWIGNSNSWITFRYVDKLIVRGGSGGTLDGQGQFAWKLNDCHKNSNCPALPASLSLEFVTNSQIHHMRSINSKNTHISVFACENVNFTNIRISAPGDSPNTDGIKIGRSTNLRITNSYIGTGDDCLAILSGSKNLHVSNVYCGPGHGISVGSLGRTPGEDVTELQVINCTLSNTQNGIRIKTWESPYPSIASNFTFQDIYMKSVSNPIVIDQTYCPYPPCNDKSPSHVQIKDVTYKNIWGTSSTELAVSLNCSRAVPCRNIIMQNINLASEMSGESKSSCSYVDGRSYGNQRPSACL